MASGGPKQALIALGAMCAGLLLLVVGTFLPWLTSGRAQRNSFAAGAAVRSLLAVHGAAGTALRWWPAVIGAAAVAVALVALDLRRVAVAVAVLAALVAGVVSVAALAAPGHGVVHVARIGPIVTLAGCVLTLVSGAAYFLHPDLVRRRAL